RYVEMAVPLHRERLVGHDVGDRIGAHARWRAVALVGHGGTGGHEPGRWEGEDVVEGPIDLGQLDGDLPGGVVGRDAADRRGLAAVVVRGADDVVGEERLAAPADLHGPLE